MATGIDPSVFMSLFEESQQRKSGGGDARYWKVKAGVHGKPVRNVIRIMPPHPNMIRTAPNGQQSLDPIVMTKVHFSLGPQSDTASPCLEPFGEPCPACEWVDVLFSRSRNEQDPAKAEQMKELAFRQRAKFNFIANIVDMSQPEAGVQMYPFGPEIEKRIRGCFLDDNVPPGFRDISDPITGRDIILVVQKKEKSDFNQYDEVRAKDSPSPLPDMDWIQGIQDLTLENYKPTPQQVHEALQGKKIDRKAAANALPPASAPRQIGASAATPTPASTPAATPTPTRGPGRPPKNAAPAPTPAPVPAAASTPAPAPARQPVRAPVAAPVAATNGGDPLVQAKAEVVRLGFASPHDLTVADLSKLWEDVNNQRPVCYGRDTEPSAPECQGCRGILPCMAVKMGILEATA